MAILDDNNLPEGWYERYGDRVVSALAQMDLADWSEELLKRRATSQRSISFLYHATANEAPVTDSSQSLNLEFASHFFNKACIAYMIGSGCRDKEEYFEDNGFQPDEWLGKGYDMWQELSTRESTEDGRYLFAPLPLHSECVQGPGALLRPGLGLGSSVQTSTETEQAIFRDGTQKLIEQHNTFCDSLEARANGPAQDGDESWIIDHRDEYDCPGASYHPSFVPTCRSMFVVADWHMSRRETVLLVLTGHNESLLSTPPTLDGIPPDQIVTRRMVNVVEVSWETAIRFIHSAMQEEEAGNGELRQKNAARRRCVVENIFAATRQEVDNFHKSGKPLSKANACIRQAWKEVVTAENGEVAACPRL